MGKGLDLIEARFRQGCRGGLLCFLKDGTIKLYKCFNSY